MTLQATARAHYASQTALGQGAAALLGSLWVQLDPTNLAASWVSQRLAERMYVALSTHQLAAAAAAPSYTSTALTQQGATSAAIAVLSPRAFAGVASDGRDLETLIRQPLIATLAAIQKGLLVARALKVGHAVLETIATTQIADAGRAAEQVAMTVEPAATGWVRMLVPPSCGRCAVLAGRVYRYNQGFLRHPRCNCRTVPAAEDTARDLRTDPDAYFASLSRTDQARYFTVAGAQAIRDGADIGQVVNARRGARGLSQPGRLTDAEQTMLRGGRARGRLERVDVYGRQVYTTTEGTTRRGIAGKKLGAWSEDAIKDGPRRSPRRARTPRLMPEAIQEIAGEDRAQAVRLLERFGYITT